MRADSQIILELDINEILRIIDVFIDNNLATNSNEDYENVLGVYNI